MAHTVAELVWLSGLLRELQIDLQMPMDLYCDNTIALQIATNPMYHKRTKHIEIDCHFLRETIQKGLIRTLHVSSQEQPSDILTKALGHQRCLSVIQDGNEEHFFILNLRRNVEILDQLE